MSYELRRLRLHGIIERIPKTHRYQLIPVGRCTALFFTRIYSRVLRSGLAQITPVAPAANSALMASSDKLDDTIDQWCHEAKLGQPFRIWAVFPLMHRNLEAPPETPLRFQPVGASPGSQIAAEIARSSVARET